MKAAGCIGPPNFNILLKFINLPVAYVWQRFFLHIFNSFAVDYPAHWRAKWRGEGKRCSTPTNLHHSFEYK
uniref:Uncharacterized protein n=1 Tax=Meloidogyne incognita TaxID=6306 RepID=A0A914L6F1_MELIC